MAHQREHQLTDFHCNWSIQLQLHTLPKLYRTGEYSVII